MEKEQKIAYDDCRRAAKYLTELLEENLDMEVEIVFRWFMDEIEEKINEEIEDEIEFLAMRLISFSTLCRLVDNRPFSSIRIIGEELNEVKNKFKLFQKYFDKILVKFLDKLYQASYNLDDEKRVEFIINVLENVLIGYVRKNFVYSELERRLIVHIFLWDNVFLDLFSWKSHSSFLVKLEKGENK